ncbi:MAG: S8 family serine peptidase [Chloroflexi bacterium]|nr:S8 family serine peptidase [Chloroflexota bacterium]MCL5274343.1 S8 family serine peptidase [Chloroflexota bacterium]
MNNAAARRIGKWFTRVLWCLALCISAGFASAPAAQSRSSTTAPLQAHADGAVISPSLQKALAGADPASSVRVIVRFARQADLAQASQTKGPVNPATRVPQMRARIVDALRSVSADSMRLFNAFLTRPDVSGQVDSVRAFWIFNGVGLNATPAVIEAIAARDDVASITLDAWRKWFDDTGTAPVTTVTSPYSRSLQLAPQLTSAPVSVTWGVARIRADLVWSSLGISGTGVTVANIDTGVDWQHPALQTSYRGWRGALPPDHLHNWYDATGAGAAYPTDLNGHGTHTMGTIAGRDGIGVAPGASWMAARALDSQGYGYSSWLHAAFQFMLAPGGDPGYAPDIVSNSWGDNNGYSTEFAADIDALRSAGIFVLFANGNAGPGPGTVGSPASLPNAIGVGATDPDDEVTYFSSRGPSPFGVTRPTISAPGLNVLSSYPGGAYATASGTSMATPHVAGAAALLLSANHSLDITSTLYALTSTAAPLTTVLPNNDTGWGRVDAYKAVLSVISTGIIKGNVLYSSLPISGALVTASNGAQVVSALTGADGSYAMAAAPGIYTATASAYGYYDAAAPPQVVISGSETIYNFNLSRLPYGVVSGAIYDAGTGDLLTQTLVTALGTPRSSYADIGMPPLYYLSLPSGAYTVEARLLGYGVQTQTVTISSGAAIDLSFYLTPTQRIALVDTGAWYYGSAAPYYRAALDALGLSYDFYRVKHVPGDVPTSAQLLKYDTIIWSAPSDSPAFVGAGTTISTLLASGRNLMISGQDIAYYDGGGFFGVQPYFPKLNAYFSADDAPSRVVVGAPDSLLAGQTYTITGGDGASNQFLPDIVALRDPDHGQLIGNYTVGQNNNSGAGVYTQLCTPYRSAYFSFGVEAINNATSRADVLRRVLSAFTAPRPDYGVELLSRDSYNTGVPIGLPGQTVTHVLRLRHTGDAGITDTFTLSMTGNAWPTAISAGQVQLAPCTSSLVTLTVTIPPTATRDTLDTITLSATSANSPSLGTAISFTSKTPAGILLVEDERFYDRDQNYLDALAAGGNHADRWDNNWNKGTTILPTAAVLGNYPIVIWYNAYNWFDPLTLSQENELRQYLDNGGRLFLTSQSALDYTELSSFNQSYLGVATIDFGDSTNNIIGAPSSAIGNDFAGGTLLPFPYNWNLSSAVLPLSGTQVILRGDSGQPFGLAREGLAASPPAVWRTSFMPFAFEVLTSTVRADLMNRVVGWLSWLGRSTLTPDHPSAAPGEPVTYTLVLRADDMPPPALHDPALLTSPLTTSVSISVPLDANLVVVSSTLSNPAAQYAGDWNGTVAAGDTLTWTFVASPTTILTDGAGLTATVYVALNDVGTRFSKSSAAHLNAPVFSSTLTIQPEPAAWNSIVTFTLHVENDSGIGAPAASLVDAVPFGLTLLTPTISLSGGGVISSTGNRIDWQGSLAAGDAVTITYQVSIPLMRMDQPLSYFNAADIGNGAGDVTQSALWVTPARFIYYMPVIMK